MWKFNEAIDEIRLGEVKLFKAQKHENFLEKRVWLLLKRQEILSNKHRLLVSENP